MDASQHSLHSIGQMWWPDHISLQGKLGNATSCVHWKRKIKWDLVDLQHCLCYNWECYAGRLDSVQNALDLILQGEHTFHRWHRNKILKLQCSFILILQKEKYVLSLCKVALCPNMQSILTRGRVLEAKGVVWDVNMLSVLRTLSGVHFCVCTYGYVTWCQCK